MFAEFVKKGEVAPVDYIAAEGGQCVRVGGVEQTSRKDVGMRRFLLVRAGRFARAVRMVETTPGRFSLDLDADEVIEELGHESTGYYREGIAQLFR
jgi:hypothetical protein